MPLHSSFMRDQRSPLNAVGKELSQTFCLPEPVEDILTTSGAVFRARRETANFVPRTMRMRYPVCLWTYITLAWHARGAEIIVTLLPMYIQYDTDTRNREICILSPAKVNAKPCTAQKTTLQNLGVHDPFGFCKKPEI